MAKKARGEHQGDKAEGSSAAPATSEEGAASSDDDDSGGLVLVEPRHVKDARIVLHIYADMKQRYYIIRDWSPEIYAIFAYHGFMSVACNDGLVPEMQKEYCMLRWPDLHVGKKVRRALARRLPAPADAHGAEARPAEEGGGAMFVLSIDSDMDGVLEGIQKAHGQQNWLGTRYASIVKQLHASSPSGIPKCDSTRGSDNVAFRYHSVEVFWVERGERKLVAGEVGYSIGAIYTSMTGFMDRSDPRFSGSGTFQLVGLGRLLEKCGYAFWNLGHPPDRARGQMVYKADIGGHVVTRKDFLGHWLRQRTACPSSGVWLGAWAKGLRLPELVLQSRLCDEAGADLPLPAAGA